MCNFNSVHLDIMMKNENKQDKMISIMEHLLKYIPAATVSDSIVDHETHENVELT